MEHGGRVHHDGHFFDHQYLSISLSGIQIPCKCFVIGEQSAATAKAADFVSCEKLLTQASVPQLCALGACAR